MAGGGGATLVLTTALRELESPLATLEPMPLAVDLETLSLAELETLGLIREELETI